MSAPAIELRDLSVAFGGVRAVDDVSVAVPEGERRAVIGPNGAGKSTLFALVAGQLRPTSGRLALLGTDVTRLPSHRRARLGLGRTFQITNLLSALTVLQNVELALGARDRTRWVFWQGLSRMAHVRERAEELLRTWRLWDLRDRRTGELAYGQQRVLEIVMALSGDPRVLLLDEPTAGLSPSDAELMVDVTAELPRSITLLVIEHDMEVAFALADQVTVLAQGRVLASGPPEAVGRDQRVIEAYLGERPRAS